MAYKAIYKKRFINRLNKLLEYFNKEWSADVATDFTFKLRTRIDSLKRNPHIGQLILKNTRTILITKHNRIYYRVEKDQLIIINMIDTRRNPAKNSFTKTAK